MLIQSLVLYLPEYIEYKKFPVLIAVIHGDDRKSIPRPRSIPNLKQDCSLSFVTYGAKYLYNISSTLGFSTLLMTPSARPCRALTAKVRFKMVPFKKELQGYWAMK